MRSSAGSCQARRPRSAIAAGHYVEDVFGDQTGFYKHPLVKASRHCDMIFAVGDYVLSGGELPALTVIDAVVRLLPGALGDGASAEQDSFSEGLLDWPHYTRPEEVEGLKVPAVLAGGDHAAIRRWRLKQALGRTWQRRPDVLQRLTLTGEQQTLLSEWLEDRKRT